jgi:hypothetical protein
VRTLTLLIRDPLPRDWPAWSPSLPALEFIAARGRSAAAPGIGPIAWLCQRFGLRPDPDWPLAPVLAQSAGSAMEHSHWLCADPIHVDVHPQQLAVARAADLELTADESGQLAAALDRHFAVQGVRVTAFDRTRWLINAPGPIRLATEPPDLPDGIWRVMASGEDAGRWNAFLTEAQMLLHGQPVNEGREARGALAVNSVYLWGGGAAACVRPVDSLGASNDPVALALMRDAGLQPHPSLDAALAQIAAMPDAVVLAVPEARETMRADRETLEAVEKLWLAPALQALKSGRLDRVALAMLGDATGMTVHTVGRGAFWKFWKRGLHLAGEPR